MPLNLGTNVQSDLLTLPLCVFGGEETWQNMEDNLKRYCEEIGAIKVHGVKVNGTNVPV